MRIGNSRGIRIPQEVLRVYGLSDGSVVELEHRREGILLRVAHARDEKLPWASAYREMAAEAAEPEEWRDWDVVSGDASER